MYTKKHTERSDVKMLCSSQCWLVMCKQRIYNALLSEVGSSELLK